MERERELGGELARAVHAQGVASCPSRHATRQRSKRLFGHVRSRLALPLVSDTLMSSQEV